ncbi:MAG: glycosyltransferase family 4 protein [Candidatus Pacebacteria bacterium]|nr:glycosyltransferase family 4 protein [Candidatus Paceibacterota bacterium]
MSNKRILIFSTAYYPFVGGAEVAIKEITDRTSGIDFHMLTARMDRTLSKKEKIGNILVHRIGFGIPKIDKLCLAFFGFFYAQRLQKQNKYSVVWAMMASYGGFAASKFKFLNPEINFLLTLQEGDSLDYIAKRTYFVKKQFKDIFIRADKIQCISTYLAEWAKMMGARCSIEVIPNGVDIKNFSQEYSEKELSDLKLKFNKTLEDKFLIHTGRLTYKNAVDDLIQALIYLPESIKILLVGKGEDEEKLRAIVQEKGLKNRVYFLGFIDHKEIPQYLRISDIFVRASLSEGLGNSFLEAMLTSLPVIATQEGGIVDFLFDEKRNPNKEVTGWAVDSRSPEQIAEAVKCILSNSEKAKKVTDTAKKMVLEKYNWDILAKEMQEKVFNKLFGSRASK